MKELNEAYEILSDEEKRRQYDLELEQDQEKYQPPIEKQEAQRQEPQKQEKEEKPVENVETIRNQNREILQNEIQNAYQKAYYQYLRSLRL